MLKIFKLKFILSTFRKQDFPVCPFQLFLCTHFIRFTNISFGNVNIISKYLIFSFPFHWSGFLGLLNFISCPNLKGKVLGKHFEDLDDAITFTKLKVENFVRMLKTFRHKRISFKKITNFSQKFW